MRVRFLDEIRDDVGMRRGDVESLADVRGEIEQERWRMLGSRAALCTARSSLFQ